MRHNKPNISFNSPLNNLTAEAGDKACKRKVLYCYISTIMCQMLAAALKLTLQRCTLFIPSPQLFLSLAVRWRSNSVQQQK